MFPKHFSSLAAIQHLGKPPDPPDQPLHNLQEMEVVNGEEPNDMNSMEFEISENQRPPQRASFTDVVNGTNRCFPTMNSILEQLQEDMEEETIELDTPLKVSFT